MHDLQAAFERWSSAPYPPCPAGIAGVDPVKLDAVAASTLGKWLRGAAAASTEYRLRTLLGTLDDQVLADASGACPAYFEALADVLRLALTAGRNA
ncbi:hypothetical protein [Deinococcus pimensis]|uniref:hypothetical protein n=1 Tax=Deinococcus pimensis TaxID=309888 RepID=UPI0004844791|nr:hypothetical protein [Deinococcus pimensis]